LATNYVLFRGDGFNRVNGLFTTQKEPFRVSGIPFVESARSWFVAGRFNSTRSNSSGIAILAIVILDEPVLLRITAMRCGNLVPRICMNCCSKGQLIPGFDGEQGVRPNRCCLIGDPI